MMKRVLTPIFQIFIMSLIWFCYASQSAMAVDPGCDIRTPEQVVEDALAKEAKAGAITKETTPYTNFKENKGKQIKIDKFNKENLEYVVDDVKVVDGKVKVTGRIKSGEKGKFKEFTVDLDTLSSEYGIDVKRLEQMSADELVFLEWARNEKKFSAKQKAALKKILESCGI